MLHIYKGGKETKGDPENTPHLADQAPCAAEEADTAGRDRIYVAYLNYSECKTGPIYRAETLQAERAGKQSEHQSPGQRVSLLAAFLTSPRGISAAPLEFSGGETGSAHMMLAGVKTGPTHKVSVISQPQDRGLHRPSVSSSCSVGSSCPRSASQATRDMA